MLKAAGGKGGKGLEGANRPSILPPKPADHAQADGNKSAGKKGNEEAAAPRRRAQSAGSSRDAATAGSAGAASVRELVSGHWRARQESRAVHAHTAYATTGVPVAPSMPMEPPILAPPTAPPPPPLEVVGEAEVRRLPSSH